MTDAEQISWQRKVLREEPVSEALKKEIIQSNLNRKKKSSGQNSKLNTIIK